MGECKEGEKNPKGHSEELKKWGYKKKKKRTRKRKVRSCAKKSKEGEEKN